MVSSTDPIGPGAKTDTLTRFASRTILAVKVLSCQRASPKNGQTCATEPASVSAISWSKATPQVMLLDWTRAVRRTAQHMMDDVHDIMTKRAPGTLGRPLPYSEPPLSATPHGRAACAVS